MKTTHPTFKYVIQGLISQGEAESKYGSIVSFCQSRTFTFDDFMSWENN